MLTTAKIEAAQPKQKVFKLADSLGLYLLVYPNGIKGWRHRIRINGRDTTLSYGNYPEVKLKRAREKRDATRVKLADGINPVAEKRAEKIAGANTFKSIATEWLEGGCPPNKNNHRLDPKSILRHTRRLEIHIYPHHGNLPISAVTVQDLHKTLRRIITKGNYETARRVRSICSRVFRYAVATGRADRDPAADLRDALPSIAAVSFAAITDPAEIGPLLRAIDGYEGQPSVVSALRLAPYVFVRPGELRCATWSEINLEKAEWLIPAARMKMSRDHWVPLAKQSVRILKEAQALSGKGDLVFPGIRSRRRPISDNTLNAALRRLGYTREQMTGHGFRSMASTRLNEMGFDADIIEAQLAHVDSNRVRAIYNRAQYAEKRRRMMQNWADYLDGLRSNGGGNVIAIGAG
ncbi:MAG TPA: tyrosine-type recombinase/integrase [Woeseiaceae bacterium]|nr:tyrosine-type recombinase/integrase [Woeseiaceae bacterium]